MSDTQIKPSFVRYKHVDNLLSKEPAFADHLGAKDKDVQHRSGHVEKVHAGSHRLTEHLCSTGKDPVALSKTALLAEASAYFLGGGSQAPVQAAAPGDGTASPPAEATRAPAPITPGLAILCLLTSAHELAKGDNEPGAKARKERVEAALQSYRALVT